MVESRTENKTENITEKTMKHFFVINPRSFPVKARMEKVLEEIRSCFEETKEDYTVHVSRYPRDAIGCIRKWAEREGAGAASLRVYAVGGDGILFDCLNGIVGLPGAELAAVPYGNSNDVVRAFGENKNALFRNIRLQAAAPVVEADIIHCGTNYALNLCTLGIESQTIMSGVTIYNVIAGKIKKWKGLNKLVYESVFYLSGAAAVLNQKLINQRYSIKADGQDFPGVYGNINIANGPCYGGNKSAVITAMPDDGMLDALFLRDRNSLKVMKLIVPYTKGEFRRFPGTFTWKRLRKIEIHSEEPLVVNLDGETFYDTDLTVEIIPRGVKLTAPGGARFQSREVPFER